MLLLLSCVGTAFSMLTESETKKQQSVQLEQLEKYREIVTKLKKKLDKCKEKFDNGEINPGYYYRKCFVIPDSIEKLRKTYEELTGFYLGYPFSIETTDLKIFVKSGFVDRNNN